MMSVTIKKSNDINSMRKKKSPKFKELENKVVMLGLPAGSFGEPAVCNKIYKRLQSI